ncbi:MAG: M20/M25/M40 family metallo-hydrolase [Methanobacteriota archaeon]
MWLGKTTLVYAAVIILLLAAVPINSGTRSIPDQVFKHTRGASDLPAKNAPPSVAPRVINTTMEIENMTMSVSEGAMLHHLEKLVAFETRYSYSPRIMDAAEYVYETFDNCGLQVEYQDYTFSGYQMRNVIGTLEGANTSAPAFYLGAHLDSTSTSAYIDASGADDDGSGVAAVLVAAETLSHYSFNRTLVFCAFSGEEQGLLGSKAFTKMLYQSGANVSGAICLDMIAYTPPIPNNVLRSRANAASLDLANFTHNISEKYPSMGINATAIYDNAANSDHAAFWTWGWDAVNFIEYNYSTNPNYHKTTDTIEYLNLTYAANATQVAIACAAEKSVLMGGDAKGPTFRNVVPLPDGHANETPVVSVCVLDPSSIDPATVQLYVNGSIVSCAVTQFSWGYNVTFEPPAAWGDTQLIACGVVANDSLGNFADLWWNFTVDATPPEVPVLASVELSRVRADRGSLAIDLGPAGSDDDYYVTSPSVMLDGALYKMWYGGCDNYPKPTSIGVYRIFYATSTDGTNWTKHGVVLSPGASGEMDSTHTADCSVVKINGTYKMWYSAHNGTTYRIMHATSPDGENWTKVGLALDLGSPGTYDDAWVANPEVLVVGSEYWMYYTGNSDIRFQVCKAVSSDGLNWTRCGFVIGSGEAGERDSVLAYGPAVYRSGTGYVCWYSGFDGVRNRLVKAVSADGNNWTKMGLALDIGIAGSYDSAAVTHPACLFDGNTTRVWYGGSNGYYRILSASLPESGPGQKKESVVLRWATAIGEVARYEVRASLTWEDCLAVEGGVWMPAQNGLFVHNGMGAGNGTAYYYSLRAADRVGHISTHWTRAAKAAAPAPAGWTPLGHIDSEMANLTAAFESLSWTGLMAWNSTDVANHWRTNFTVRPSYMNDLASLWSMAGCWVKTNNASTYVSVCLVKNFTVQLQPGWNFVSYPHMAIKTAAQTMGEIGSECASIEGFDQSATYRLKALSGTDPMSPGRAYWLFLTASATWTIQNY